jgi:hypothetical protein
MNEQVQKAVEYATKRRAETGYAYIVSNEGHAMLDCANNRRVFKECELDIVHRS